jgi:hypothetical protein
MVVEMLSLTARDLIHKLADETSLSYKEVARRVNQAMSEGSSLLKAIHMIVKESHLSPDDFQISSTALVNEAKTILMEDYTQTLMISAVMAQMVEAEGTERLPIPAFFAFMEVLAMVEEAPRDDKSESSTEIDKHTTRMIELMTTLVSVICEWSEEGIVGICKDCPQELKEVAQQIHWKTKMYQSGIWSCISCGNMVDVKDTKALMCRDCDVSISGEITRLRPQSPERDRIGYGQTRDSDES